MPVRTSPKSIASAVGGHEAYAAEPDNGDGPACPQKPVTGVRISRLRRIAEALPRGAKNPTFVEFKSGERAGDRVLVVGADPVAGRIGLVPAGTRADSPGEA